MIMQPDWPEKVITFITRILTVIATIALTVMMFLTAADVFCRYFFNNPISGAMELVEYLMAIIVPFSIAYCALQKSHVAVDLIVDHFPKNWRRICHFFITIPSIGFILLICWQNYLSIFDTYDSKMTSAVLLIPAYPFVIPVATGTLVFAVIMLIQLFGSKTKEASHGGI
jgi:TRAP-type C4-dicarboxylate transport system permease small subunit